MVMVDGSTSCWSDHNTNMAQCDAGGRGSLPKQTNANPPPLFADEEVLGDAKVAPFVKRGVSFLAEPCSGVDVLYEVQVIVH